MMENIIKVGLNNLVIMNEFCYLEFDLIYNNREEKSKLKSIIENSIIKILGFIFPKANPDFESLYDNVKKWKIEFNISKTYTERELGFDKDGNLIVITPYKRNYGFWTDNTLSLDDYNYFEPLKITKEEFDKDWSSFTDK